MWTAIRQPHPWVRAQGQVTHTEVTTVVCSHSAQAKTPSQTQALVLFIGHGISVVCDQVDILMAEEIPHTLPGSNLDIGIYNQER